MKARWLLAAVTLLGWPASASAHRLDEYLQAATFALGKERVEVELRLTPGVAVSPAVLQAIDTNGDGAFSEAEGHAYAEEVRRDLALAVDGEALPLRLTSASYPEPEAIAGGLGDIFLGFEATVPRGGPLRTLVFENHHEPAISAYLQNAVITPAAKDRRVRIGAQKRSYDQSSYALEYAEAGPDTSTSRSERDEWLVRGALVLLGLSPLARDLWRHRKRRLFRALPAPATASPVSRSP